MGGGCVRVGGRSWVAAAYLPTGFRRRCWARGLASPAGGLGADRVVFGVSEGGAERVPRVRGVWENAVKGAGLSFY